MFLYRKEVTDLINLVKKEKEVILNDLTILSKKMKEYKSGYLNMVKYFHKKSSM